MSARDHTLFRTLQTLRDHRRPFERLSRRLLAEVLRRHVLETPGPIVEIGAGDGQLMEWLPAAVLARTLHTEPVAAAATELSQRQPRAAVATARADALPLTDGAAAAVIGLCVLDVVPDGGAVARELARVIRPGGHFIHLLDMSTHLGGWFRELVKGAVVPLPNFFSDPSASHWPDDLFLAPAAQLRRVLDLLTSVRHPLARPLRQYVTLFEAEPFPEHRALAEFAQISASSELRLALRLMFQTAFKLAEPRLRAELSAFQGCVLSSSRCFERRLRQWFSPTNGFQVIESDVVNVAERTPQPRTQALQYQSLCVGERRTLAHRPKVPRRPGAALSTLSDPSRNEVIRELGTFVFVARRHGHVVGQ